MKRTYSAAFAAFLVTVGAILGAHLHAPSEARAATPLTNVIAGGLYNATAGTAGFMPGADKTKLDALPDNAALTASLAAKLDTSLYLNPLRTFYFTDEFITAPATSQSLHVSNITGNATVASTTTGTDTTHLGAWLLSTGTSSPTNRASILLGTGAHNLTFGTAGAAEMTWFVRPTSLQNVGVQDWVDEVGLLDSTTQPTANGIYFRYDATDTHWQVCTAAAASRTCTATSTTVQAATWVKLTATKANGTANWTFAIDGVSTGITNSTNLPTAVLSTWFNHISTTGTTAKTVAVDLVKLKVDFSSDRGL